MSFQKSPGLNDFREIMPEKEKALTRTQKVTRVLIGFIALLIFVLAGLNFWKSDMAAPLRGTGSLRGIALDQNGQPFNGNIFVEGTELMTTTKPDGSFELNYIPAGHHIIVVADTLTGREFPIEIVVGQVSNLGTITFRGTATP
jgi:hypothetical protein